MIWSRSPANASCLKARLNGRDTDLVSSTVSARKVPKAYGWIEFPAWAVNIRELNDLIDSASKRAKECENYGGTIRLSDMVPNGRFSDLESKFQEFRVPYDCGGEAPGEHITWGGWWRVGCRYPVQYEVSSIGEQFVSLDDLRDVLSKYEENTPLYAALRELIKKNDNSPPVAIRDTNATYSIARPGDT
jgi:hypothetical protein